MQAVDIADRQETQVYYVEDLDVFHVIDRHAKPTARDWVVVRCRGAPGFAIESFCGQRFLGVARILNFYQLQQSEQEAIRSTPVHSD